MIEEGQMFLFISLSVLGLSVLLGIVVGLWLLEEIDRK